jgi:hypothetical protein
MTLLYIFRYLYFLCFYKSERNVEPESAQTLGFWSGRSAHAQTWQSTQGVLKNHQDIKRNILLRFIFGRIQMTDLHDTMKIRNVFKTD